MLASHKGFYRKRRFQSEYAGKTGDLQPGLTLCSQLDTTSFWRAWQPPKTPSGTEPMTNLIFHSCWFLLEYFTGYTQNVNIEDTNRLRVILTAAFLLSRISSRTWETAVSEKIYRSGHQYALPPEGWGGGFASIHLDPSFLASPLNLTNYICPESIPGYKIRYCCKTANTFDIAEFVLYV